jgi:hypothetical protein
VCIFLCAQWLDTLSGGCFSWGIYYNFDWSIIVEIDIDKCMCVAPGLMQILLTLYDDDGFIAINKNRIEWQ